MVELDTSTPQLKVVKKVAEAYASLDTNKIEPFLSKNYQYEPLPESTDLPKQTKESHLQMWREIISTLKKLGVRVRYRRTAFRD